MSTVDNQVRENPLCVAAFAVGRNLFAAAGLVVFVAVAACSRSFWWPMAGVVRRGDAR